MTIDSQLQRKIMGMFATGVTVVSMETDEGSWGMTANAFTSLSLDPPLVLVAVDKDNTTNHNLRQANHFAVNILSADQETLSNRFAFTGPKDFSGLETTTAITGAPIIGDTLGWVDCELHEILEGGDHDIFVGKILAGDLGQGAPLLYFQGGYAGLAETPTENESGSN